MWWESTLVSEETEETLFDVQDDKDNWPTITSSAVYPSQEHIAEQDYKVFETQIVTLMYRTNCHTSM